jgi:hypothetical protein
MATSKKPTTNKPTAVKNPVVKNQDDFAKAYVRLRTVLDALEIGALQRCLEEQTPELRIKRAQEIETLLLPIIKKIKKDKPTRADACAEGYWNCGGVCVPYQCPTDK